MTRNVIFYVSAVAMTLSFVGHIVLYIQQKKRNSQECKKTPKKDNKLDQQDFRNKKSLKTLQASKKIEKNDEKTDFDQCDDGDVSRRIRKAETVLQRRTSRIILVLEAACDPFNVQAVLRSAECFGVQHIWIVEAACVKEGRNGRKIARESEEWLSIRRFKTTSSCIAALKEEGCEIWVTDLGQGAEKLGTTGMTLPSKLAIVMGREADGASQEMFQAADRRVYLPIHGFADSLNLSVATALVLQILFIQFPEARGDMKEDEKKHYRKKWYSKLAKTEAQVKEFLSFVEKPPLPYDDLRRPDEHRSSWVMRKVRKRVLAKERHIANEEMEHQNK